MKANVGGVAEPLESRLLAAASPGPGGPYTPVPMPPADLVAGVPIRVGIAALQGVDASAFGRLIPRAIIRWGDGRDPSAVPAKMVGYLLQADAPIRPRAYRLAGTYTARVVFRLGGRVIGRVTEDIVVNENSPGGLTLDSAAGQPFAGALGTFTAGFPAGPVINWGDGTHSPGALEAVGDRSFRVSGSHTYRRPGKYRVIVEAWLNPPPGSKILSTFGPVLYSTMIVTAV